MSNAHRFIVTLFLSLVCGGARADVWAVDSATSFINFGSIKAESIGESHRFRSFEGSVDEAGRIDIAIDLVSVATGIDIRNERMRQFLFQTDIFPKARLSGAVQLEALEALAVGQSATVPLDLKLSLHGQEAPVGFDAVVTRLGPDKAQIIPAELIFITPDTFDLEGGLAKLQQLAGLDSITQAVPVSFRLIFQR